MWELLRSSSGGAVAGVDLLISGPVGQTDIEGGTWARGQVDMGDTREARRLRGSVDQKNIIGSQVSAIGSQVRVFRFGYGCGWGN